MSVWSMESTELPPNRCDQPGMVLLRLCVLRVVRIVPGASRIQSSRKVVEIGGMAGSGVSAGFGFKPKPGLTTAEV